MLCYLCVLSLGCSRLVVSTSASDWLERLVSEMTYNVLMGTLNPTHSLTHSLSHSQQLMFLLRCSVWKGSRRDEQTCCESADSRQFCRLPQLHGLGPGLILLFTARVSYLTLPSGTGVLPPSAEASIGPSAHPCINPKFTETLCTLQVFANLRIVLQCSCLRPLDPGKYNSKNFRESLSKGRGDVKPWVWMGLSSLWLIGVALSQYPGSTTT